ncbi:hypothetical protein D6D12_10130 [Aureobasidium pullulans]|uniref:SET domain-containing protein n=1 Tax=Aureobasidium pullulans TaxID=5580 RepID=A0AB74JD94_AURPU|nr:hypothetical protein D6D12_10130 [Aureobasidium pullulans]THX54200.1 hypothetical protein D6D11_04224 [Aureobasidium pullulans]
MDDLLRLMEQATLSLGARRVDSKFAPTERSKDQITYENYLWTRHRHEISAKERAIQETFERNFLECLQRPSICREELKLSSLSYTQDFGIVTQLYPGRRSTQRLARALREDDCSNNPYLKWSRRDILSALQNRQIAISEPDSESRCKCRLALKVADKTATFHFLELPKEVRMLVYEQALLHQGVFKHDSHAPPALLQINQQVRQESREIFFSINCFRLRTRRCIIRRSDKTAKTHQTVRFVDSFITRLGINGGKGIQLDLAIPDVSRWAQPLKCGCRECQTKAPWTVGQQIEKSDKKKKWLDSCCSNPEILILYTKALEEEIRTRDSAQMAMNGFGERYGKGKSVKPTIEGLELLGGCIMQNFGRKEWIWSHCRD